MKKKLGPRGRRNVCRSAAFIISAGVPLAATVSYFDFFVQRAETTISAIAMIAIILAAVSMKDTLLKFLKSPSALKVWLVVFVLAVIFNNIAYQFMVVSAFGLAAQGLCMPLHMLDKRYTTMLEKEQGIDGNGKT